MAVGMSMPVCPEGSSVTILTSYFEHVAIVDKLQNMKDLTLASTTHGGSVWLDFYREKRLLSDKRHNTLTTTVAPPCGSVQHWLDIYREKRRQYDVQRRHEQNQRKIDKQDLEQRLLMLIQRCGSLSDMLDKAVNQSKMDTSFLCKQSAHKSSRKTTTRRACAGAPY